MSKPTTMTLRSTKHYVEVVGLSLAEAEEMFGGKVSEEWGTVRVTETKLSAIKSALRDAGYRTATAK